MTEEYIKKRPNPGWEIEMELTRKAIRTENNLSPKPRFFVVCGDLIHAMPGEAEPEIILTIDGEALDETVDQESQNGVTVTPCPPTPVAGTEETPAKASLKATYSMFRKQRKKYAPSAAQKAASSIEEKYRLEIQVLKSKEERDVEEHMLKMRLRSAQIQVLKSKEERDVEEHMLKMRLLSAQIKFQENLNRILHTNPTSLKHFIK